MIFLFEMWGNIGNIQFPRFREHIVYDPASVNRIMAQSNALFFGLASDLAYSDFYRASVSTLTSTEHLVCWEQHEPLRAVISRQAIEKLGMLEPEHSLEDSIVRYVEKSKSAGIAKEICSAQTSAADQTQKRVAFFAPFGSWTVHNQFDAMIASTMRVRGTPQIVIGCDGVFTQNCYVATHAADQAECCRNCAAQGQHFFSQFGIQLTQIKNFIAAEEISSFRSWADSLDPNGLLDADYQGLPVGRIAAPSTSSYFRVPPTGLLDKNVQRVFRRYIGDVLIAFKAVSRIFDEFKPSHLVLYNGCNYLYAAALAVARCRGVRIIGHERGLMDGSFMLASDNNTGNPLTYFGLADAWKEVALNTEELEWTKNYYAERENGRGSNLAPFYDFKSDHSDLRRKLAIPPEKKIVSFFTSSEHELLYWEGYREVEQQLQFIDHLIDIFKDRDEYLVIRHHPNIGGHLVGRPDYSYLRRAYKQAFNAPANVRVIMPHEELTSYALLWHSTASIAAITSVANEAAARGIPTAAFKSGYVSLGVSYTIKDFDRTAAQETVDFLLGTSAPKTTEILRKAYRYTNGLYRKFSVPFKSFAIENGGPSIKVQSFDQLLPGIDPNLDRLCDHIIKGTPIHPLPSSLDHAYPVTEENSFFESEAASITKYREMVLTNAKLNYTKSSERVAVIELCSSGSGSRFGHQRLKPSTVTQIDSYGAREWPREVAIAVEQCAEEYVMLASSSIDYDPAWIMQSTDSLASKSEKIAVAWGAWLSSSDKFRTDLFGRDKQPKSADELTSLMPSCGSCLLLGLQIWRKMPLLNLLNTISKHSSENERINCILTALHGPDIDMKKRPLAVLNEALAGTPTSVNQSVPATGRLSANHLVSGLLE